MLSTLYLFPSKENNRKLDVLQQVISNTRIGGFFFLFPPGWGGNGLVWRGGEMYLFGREVGSLSVDRRKSEVWACVGSSGIWDGDFLGGGEDMSLLES